MFSLLPPLIIPLNLKILNFFGFRHSFRGLTPLKPKNFDQKFNFFIITQIFAQRSSLDILINTTLHNIVELENLIYFFISSLISWASTFKTQEFRPKIENSIITLKFSRCSSLDVLIITSLHHTIELKNFNFFWISSLISWANTFKTQEFRPKIENFHHHFKIFTMIILRCFNYYLPSSYR